MISISRGGFFFFLPGSNRVFSSSGVAIAESNEFIQQRRIFFTWDEQGFFIYFLFLGVVSYM